MKLPKLISSLFIVLAAVTAVGCSSTPGYATPNFRVADIRFDHRDSASTLLSTHVLLEIENRDARPLPLKGLTADFKIEGQTLFSGVTSIDQDIPGYSVRTTNLSLKSDVFSIVRAIALLPKAGQQVHYQIELKGQLGYSPYNSIRKTIRGTWPPN